MSDPAPNRQPAGIPVGGQFAPKSTAEADLCLLDGDLIGSAAEQERSENPGGQTAWNDEADDLAAALAASQAWVGVGVTSSAEMRRLAYSGINPEDLVDPDRNPRMDGECASKSSLGGDDLPRQVDVAALGHRVQELGQATK